MPRFEIGDPIPAISMPDRTGRAVNLAHQDYAGDALAIWITSGDVPAPALADARRLVRRFAELDTRLIHVAVAAHPDLVAAPAHTALLQLFDPQGQLAELVGLGGSGVVVIDCGGRLSQIFEGVTPEKVVALCRRDPASPRPIAGQAPVLLIPGVLEPELCARLIDYWELSDKEDSTVASSGGNQVTATHVKRRADVALQDLALFEDVKSRIERRVAPEMFKVFQFRIARLEAIRIGCYDAAERGEFRRHRDNATPYTAHRKFAMSLNLNTGGYKGGAVAFPEYGRQTYSPEAGGAVVFSCSLLHEAQPVLKGRRFGLFTFFTDAEGAARETAMLAEHGDKLTSYTVR